MRETLLSFLEDCIARRDEIAVVHWRGLRISRWSNDRIATCAFQFARELEARGIGAGDPYYDPAAWAPVTEPRFGNTGRNSVRGPGWWNVDLGLFRRFPIGRTTLEARIEAFNLTNTPHFDNPNGFANSPGFMTITSARPDERQFRLGLRVSF